MDPQSPSAAKKAAHSPTTSHSQSSTTQLRKMGSRRPLQPKNIPSDLIPLQILKPKPKQSPINPSDNNKENELTLTATTGTRITTSPVNMEFVDGSLAEELSAERRRLERLRLDKDNTEKILKEKDRMFDFKIMELNERGEVQLDMENELDRLYRLKQLQIAFKRMSPIRSLREKQMEKKMNNEEVVAMQNEDLSSDSKEESINQSGEETPCSNITFSDSEATTPQSIISSYGSSSKVACTENGSKVQ